MPRAAILKTSGCKVGWFNGGSWTRHPGLVRRNAYGRCAMTDV
jgi:hypothetical protein